MMYIQEIFVGATLGFIVLGFALGVVLDLDRYYTKKGKHNKLNKRSK